MCVYMHVVRSLMFLFCGYRHGGGGVEKRWITAGTTAVWTFLEAISRHLWIYLFLWKRKKKENGHRFQGKLPNIWTNSYLPPSSFSRLLNLTSPQTITTTCRGCCLTELPLVNDLRHDDDVFYSWKSQRPIHQHQQPAATNDERLSNLRPSRFLMVQRKFCFRFSSGRPVSNIIARTCLSETLVQGVRI